MPNSLPLTWFNTNFSPPSQVPTAGLLNIIAAPDLAIGSSYLATSTEVLPPAPPALPQLPESAEAVREVLDYLDETVSQNTTKPRDYSC